jgi:Tfp pilus assembly ATPase PilU
MYRLAKLIAPITGQSVDELVEDSILLMVANVDSEILSRFFRELSADQIMDLATSTMREAQQKQMSALLELNRSGDLDAKSNKSLDFLLKVYHAGNMLKGHAIGEAIQRGLMQSSNS